MSPRRRLRWSPLLVLPLLVGALLVMHGLDARADGTPSEGVRSISAHPHEVADPGTGSADGHCAACAAGHVVAACVAIVASVAGLRAARPILGAARRLLVAAAAAVVRAGGGPLRPPPPAWVRLAVMRC